MSDNESDESLNTDDMNEIVETKKEVMPTGGCERSSAPNPKKDKVKKDNEDITENVIEEKSKPKKEKLKKKQK